MIRSFDSQLSLSDDGRSVIGRMFPFGETKHIREMVAGQLDEYDETFLPGCTTRMRQVAEARGGSPSWIRFTLDHEAGFDHRVGFCQAMVEDADGVIGTFRLYDDAARLDKVRSMLSESHTGLSIEFDDAGAPLTGELRARKQINISAVTATPIPVYESARVLAVRSDDNPLASAGFPNLDLVRAMLAEMPTIVVDDS